MVKGAPEVIIQKCSQMATDFGSVELFEKEVKEFQVLKQGSKLALRFSNRACLLTFLWFLVIVSFNPWVLEGL